MSDSLFHFLVSPSPHLFHTPPPFNPPPYIPFWFQFAKSVSSWKRNLFRATLVFLTSGFAMFLKNYFFYVSALLGSVGSIALAYILPCFFHLSLCRRGSSSSGATTTMPWSVWAKDVAIILVGVATGALGLYSVIKKFIENPHGFV